MLEGKVAIVTGASRGIGAGVAQRLAAEGVRVALTARTGDRHPHLSGSLDDTLDVIRSNGGQAIAIVADLIDAGDRERIVSQTQSEFGEVDILVNNAAANFFLPFEKFSAKRFGVMFEVNVHAPFDLAQRVLPAMRRKGRGWIVNVTSAVAADAEGPPFDTFHVQAGPLLYGMSKAALNRFTTGLAAELYDQGVAVNGISPVAAVATPGTVALGLLPDDPGLVEDLEVMVEAIVALCCCPQERTGSVTTSRNLLAELSRTVMSLDGTSVHQDEADA
jgi:NAD(P)-dependent dehydrogenase (short-subunit alcohol dehydrogenase family)